MHRSYWNFQCNCITGQDHEHHQQLPHWLQSLTTIQHQTRSTPSCTMHTFLNSTPVPLLQWLRETLYPLAWKIPDKTILEEFKEHYPQTWPTSLLLQTHNTLITTVIWGCQDYLPYTLMQFSDGIFIHHEDSPHHILTKSFFSLLKSQLSFEELNCKQWCTASHHRTPQLSSLRHKHLRISKTHMNASYAPGTSQAPINLTFNFPSMQAKPTWQQEKGLASPHLQVSNINWNPIQLLSLKTSLPDSLNIKETEKALESQKAFEEKYTALASRLQSLKDM